MSFTAYREQALEQPLLGEIDNGTAHNRAQRCRPFRKRWTARCSGLQGGKRGSRTSDVILAKTCILGFLQFRPQGIIPKPYLRLVERIYWAPDRRKHTNTGHVMIRDDSFSFRLSPTYRFSRSRTTPLDGTMAWILFAPGTCRLPE